MKDFIYIFGKFNQHTSTTVAEPHLDIIDDNYDEMVISVNQPVE